MLVSIRTLSRVEKPCASLDFYHTAMMFIQLVEFTVLFLVQQTVSVQALRIACTSIYMYALAFALLCFAMYTKTFVRVLLFSTSIYSASAYLPPCSHHRSKLRTLLFLHPHYLTIPSCAYTSLYLRYVQFFALVSVKAISLIASFLFHPTFLYSCSRLLTLLSVFAFGLFCICVFSFHTFFSLLFLLFVLVLAFCPQRLLEAFFLSALYCLLYLCLVCALPCHVVSVCPRFFKYVFFRPLISHVLYLLNLLRLLLRQLAICLSLFIAFWHAHRLARMGSSLFLLATRLIAYLFVLAYVNLFTCRTSVPLICSVQFFFLTT